MPTTHLKIAAGYIRVSTEDQTEFSPDAQRKALQRWASSNGYLLPEQYIFSDEGISGRKAEKRPGFQAMIAAAKSKEHPFDAILVHKFDRFARSREDSVVYKSLLRKECGVRVISITESIEDDKFSIILESMLEAMAEYYSINLAEEVKKGMTEKALRGGRQCTASFGYRLENGKMVPDDTEAPLVREIFSLFLSGTGCFPIAQELTARGIRTHRGSAFENRTVEYILRNPVYIGKLRWNPTGRTRRDFTNEHIILADGDHEPLVDLETWDAVQKRLDEQKQLRKYHGRPNYDRKHWLAGIVRCDACDSTLVFTAPHYFKCNGYAHGKCKTTQHTSVELLEESFLARLRRDASPKSVVDVNVIRTSDGTESKKEALQTKLERVKQKRERLREAYLAGADTVEEYRQMKSAIDEEAAALEASLASLQDELSQKRSATLLRSRIRDTLKTLDDPAATIAQKYDAINAIIETCHYSKLNETLTITYRLAL